MRSLVLAPLIAGSLCLAPMAAWADPAPVMTDAPAPVTAPVETPPDAAAPAIDPEMAATIKIIGEKRHLQLTWHQGLALGALFGMATTAVLGQVLSYQKDNTTNDLTALTVAHVSMASLTALSYAGAATLAMTAPHPPEPSLQLNEGFDPVVLHRGLTALHAATLGATLTLGVLMLFNNPSLRTVHQVMAYTTTGLMAISGGLIVFNF